MSNVGARGVFRNSANRISNYAKGASGIVMGLVSIFMVIAVGLIIYWIYNAWNKSKSGDAENPILVDGSINAFEAKNSKSWTLPESANSNSPSMAFTLSFWMYIADWEYNYNNAKVLFVKANDPSEPLTSAPAIYLHPKENTLSIVMGLYGDVNECVVPNIPLQKWVHVAYVLDNRVSDVYINGKLERSCILDNLPKLNNGDLYLLPDVNKNKKVGFYGQLASVRYFSRSLQPTDVARLYNQGPHVTQGMSTKDTTSDAGSGGGGNCPSSSDDDTGVEAQAEAKMNNLSGEIKSYWNKGTASL